MAARIPARPAPTTTTSCRTITRLRTIRGDSACSLPSRTRRRRGQGPPAAGVTSLLQARDKTPVLGYSGLAARPLASRTRSFLGGPLAKMAFALPAARQVHRNLSQQELLERSLAMPNARRTSYGAPNVQTEVLARSKGSTYIVADEPDSYPHQAIDRDEWNRVT